MIPVIGAISGCSTLSVQEPTGGDLARVRFATTSDAISVLRAYEGPDCGGQEEEWMRLRNGMIITGSTKRLGIPLWDHHRNAAKEVFVPAGQPLHAMFFGAEGSRTVFRCAVAFTFSPEVNRDYEVTFTWGYPACDVSVFEIVPGGGGVHERVPVARFANKVSSPTSACMQRFRRSRLW